jgi:hypothetical protein
LQENRSIPLFPLRSCMFDMAVDCQNLALFDGIRGSGLWVQPSSVGNKDCNNYQSSVDLERTDGSASFHQ